MSRAKGSKFGTNPQRVTCLIPEWLSIAMLREQSRFKEEMGLKPSEAHLIRLALLNTTWGKAAAERENAKEKEA